MKRLIAQTVLAIPIWFGLGGMTLAMCMWFVPPQRQFTPATNMQTLIARTGNQVSMTVQPQFTGTATDFALVMPFPSEPSVSEAPEDIFMQLEEVTNPLIEQPDVIVSEDSGDTSATEDDIRIIEERDVGDFSAVTLEASSETALIEWLQQEGYELSDEKADIVAKYVGERAYFVALKVNMATANIDDSGFLRGELRPIRFVYEADTTVLPLQLMATDSALVSLTVYTLGEEYAYLPGAEIRYAKKVDADALRTAPTLEDYNAWQKWLVRNVFQVQTDEINQDLSVLTTDDARVVAPGDTPLVLNPDMLAPETGVLVSANGEIVYTQENEPDQLIVRQASSLFNASMVILLAISNVVLLVFIIVQHNTHASLEK